LFRTEATEYLNRQGGSPDIIKHYDARALERTEYFPVFKNICINYIPPLLGFRTNNTMFGEMVLAKYSDAIIKEMCKMVSYRLFGEKTGRDIFQIVYHEAKAGVKERHGNSIGSLMSGFSIPKGISKAFNFK
jgi:hypothetical protein